MVLWAPFGAELVQNGDAAEQPLALPGWNATAGWWYPRADGARSPPCAFRRFDDNVITSTRVPGGEQSAVNRVWCQEGFRF